MIGLRQPWMTAGILLTAICLAPATTVRADPSAERGPNSKIVAPKFSFNYGLRPEISIFGALARGIRAPQTSELYRLQSGQQVADLDSERIDSIEFGVRWSTERRSGGAALFAMQKRESVFRDSDGFNVTVAARGETFVSGNDVDSAPRWLGSAELLFEPANNAAFILQWVSLGDYYLDAENRFCYPGHLLMNLRTRIDLSQRLSVTARFNNLCDGNIADRADYAFGQYRYFPAVAASYS